MAQRVYLTIAEVYQMQHQLIDMFGGLPSTARKPAITTPLKKRQPR